jgi:hypothetical protein
VAEESAARGGSPGGGNEIHKGLNELSQVWVGAQDGFVGRRSGGKRLLVPRSRVKFMMQELAARMMVTVEKGLYFFCRILESAGSIRRARDDR